MELNPPNFHLLNYYDNLSDSVKVSLEHNNYYTHLPIDLHKLRNIFFNSTAKVVKQEWLVETQDNNFSYETKYHVTDDPIQHDKLLDDKLETKILQQNGYAYLNDTTRWVINDNVRYKFNKFGLRCEELTDKDCIAFFGCSHTFGTGLDQSHIWPEIVSKNLGLRCVNIGFPARGIDLCSLYAELFFKAEIKNCKAIVVMLPPPARKSTFIHTYDHESKIKTGIYQNEWLETNLEQNYYRKNLDDIFHETVLKFQDPGNPTQILAQDTLDKHNCFKRTSSALRSITLLAKELDVPIKMYSSFIDLDVGVAGNTDFARDNMHGGVKTHNKFANRVVNELQQILDK